MIFFQICFSFLTSVHQNYSKTFKNAFLGEKRLGRHFKKLIVTQKKKHTKKEMLWWKSHGQLGCDLLYMLCNIFFIFFWHLLKINILGSKFGILRKYDNSFFLFVLRCWIDILAIAWNLVSFIWGTLIVIHGEY